ncbi:MAG: cysteine desulfurase family protein [Oscillospiraceae bacterium]
MSVYLDNAATTKPCEPAVSAAFYAMIENFGNPSSLHRLGLNAELAIKDARKSIAAAIVAAPECIFFTSGATESNNMAIFGAAQCYGKRKKKIVTTTIEHPSVAEPIKCLEEQGFEVVRIAPNRSGKIDYQEIIDAVDENTCLVSCMLVNNENGYILPIKRAFTAIKRDFPECITHCDCVQGFLKIPIKSTELYADLISLSGHKVHAVKGVGAIFVKKGIRLAPLIRGGGQEKGLRSGTESVPLICGFGAAVKALNVDFQQAAKNSAAINAYLREKLSAIPEISINSDADSSSAYILNISANGIRSEIMLHFLESKEVYVSSGSACSKGAKSSVLKEFGANDKTLDSALRISISRETTWSDIDTLAETLREGLKTLQR